MERAYQKTYGKLLSTTAYISHMQRTTQFSFGLLVLDSWYQVVRSVVFQFHLSGEERSSFGSINTSDIETTKNRRLINS